jgi:ABC-type multidrug transport system fused ATPase/permease subunit
MPRQCRNRQKKVELAEARNIAEQSVYSARKALTDNKGKIPAELETSINEKISAGVWTVCFLAFQVYVAHLRQPVRTARAEADTKVVAALADAISNHSTAALFSGGMFERERFSTTVSIWQKITYRSWTVDEYIWGGIGLFMTTIEIGLLYGAMQFWQQGLLTIGDFVLIQAYLLTTFDRLVSINRELRRFYDAFADASEMVAILETPHEVKDIPHAKPLHIKKGEISFADVDFYFHNGRAVLKKLNMNIKSGERIAFVGPSGAGKSTITKLLLRFYDVKAGKIEIDGQNIAEVTQDSLHHNIAFVPQEPILFHRTLMENIRYGRRDATDKEVVEAAQKSALS